MTVLISDPKIHVNGSHADPVQSILDGVARQDKTTRQEWLLGNHSLAVGLDTVELENLLLKLRAIDGVAATFIGGSFTRTVKSAEKAAAREAAAAERVASKAAANAEKRAAAAEQAAAKKLAAERRKSVAGDDDFLLATSATDYGNALCIHKLFGSAFAINEALGLVYFDGKRWRRENAESMLSDATIKTLRRRGKLGFDHDKGELIKKSIPNGSNINVCMLRFKLLPEVYIPVDKFDAQPHLLNCSNGVINLRTGKLLAHDARYLITQLVETPYRPDAAQATWLSFLATVIGDFHAPGVADYVKMLGGYSITGETREQILIYLLGKKGRNGKGVFVDEVQYLLGDYSTGAEFTTLTRKRDGGDQGFDIAKLRGARWVVTSESGREDRLNEAKVKELTGQDTITVAHKNKDPFSFKPTFKVWALSNHEPKGDVDDDAFWNRVKIVNFPHSFAGREDKGLRDRLMSPVVLEGVLAWLVEGAVAWYGLGSKGLQAPDSVKQQVADTRDQQDSVRAWVKDDCIAGDKILFCKNEILYDAYRAWCDEVEREDTTNPLAFSKRLSAMGFERTSRFEDKKTVRGFIGIRPKDNVERGIDSENEEPPAV